MRLDTSESTAAVRMGACSVEQCRMLLLAVNDKTLHALGGDERNPDSICATASCIHSHGASLLT